MWFLKDMVKLGKLIIKSFAITFCVLVYSSLFVKFCKIIYMNL